MRIPGNHFLLHQYIKKFGLQSNLFEFQMENFFIYISGYGETLTYDKFNRLLQGKEPEKKEDIAKLAELFPGLKPNEKGKTCDELFAEATDEVVKAWWNTYEAEKSKVDDAFAIKAAYEDITKKYDKYTLRSYLTERKNWSPDAINLYDLGNAHVVFENGFIESFKDAFLSSNEQGGQAGMQQLKQGMDAVPNAFISPERGDASLIDNITYGARVTAIEDLRRDDVSITPGKVRTHFTGPAGKPESIDSDYLVLAIPYTSQRSISKNRNFVAKQEMAIRDVRYVEVTKVLLQYKTRWWEHIFEKGTKGTSPDGGLVSDLPIRYTMFPKKKGNPQFDYSKRGVIMAAYTFEQDATILGALSPEKRVRLAAENLDRIYPEAKSLDILEAGASQVFPADELAGGSAFCYFGPTQKSEYLETMCKTDWNDRVFFAGEQASYTHGWIQGALEAGLRCTQQIWNVATTRPQ